MIRKFRRRGVSLAIALALASQAAGAQAVLPENPVATSGSGIVDDGVPNVLTIAPSTPRLTVDWTSFSIGAGGTVNFQQAATQFTGNTVKGTTVSYLSGLMTGAGFVGVRNDNGILMGGTYTAPGGELDLLSSAVAGFSGSIDLHGANGAHGGDVYLRGDQYIEVSGDVRVGGATTAQAGSLHVITGDNLDVVGAVTSYILPDGTHAGSNIPSQVSATTLSGTGGSVYLSSQKALWTLADVHVPGSINLQAQDVTIVESGLYAGTNIAMLSNRWVEMYGSLHAGGDVTLEGPQVSVSGAITANRIVVHATSSLGAGLGTSDASGITANVLTGQVAGPFSLSGQGNHVAAVSNLAVQDMAYFANDGDLTVTGLVANATNFLLLGHDLDATGPGNQLGSLNVNARQANVVSAGSLGVVNLTTTGNASVTAAGGLDFGYYNTVGGDLTIKAGGDITQPYPYGMNVTGNASFDAGTHDIKLVDPINTIGGVISMKGGAIDYRTYYSATFGDIHATNSLSLAVGSGHLLYQGVVEGDIVAPTIHFTGGSYAVGNGHAGSLTGNVETDQALYFVRTDRYAFNGDISGAGQVLEGGGGVLALNGHVGATGGVSAMYGTLLVGDASHPGAVVDGDATASGTLGGTGRIAGNVTIGSNATLAPGDGVGTLRVGSLTMLDGSTLAIQAGAPGTSFAVPGTADSVRVDGDVVFKGNVQLGISDGGGLGAGLYNILAWGGTLDESAGSLQLANADPAFTLQRDLAGKRIDLLSSKGMVLQFWNANGMAQGAQRGGGAGTWSNRSATWTDSVGTVTLPMSPSPGFAIFAGAPGDVHVGGSMGQVATAGMQFAVDGYSVSGDPLLLSWPTDNTNPTVVVGDGSAASTGMVATIHNALVGQASLVKDGAGTLVLTGTNTYTVGTFVKAGTLAVSTDNALGASSSPVVLLGGTLRIDGTDFHSTLRDVSVNLGTSPDARSGIDISDAANTFTLDDHATYTGSGTLVKTGAGTLVFTGSDPMRRFGGVLDVEEGTVRGSAGVIAGDIINNATVVFDQASDSNTFGGTAGTGTFVKQGQGTLGFDGQSTFAGKTIVEAGGLEVGTFLNHPNGPALLAGLGGDVAVARGAVLSGNGIIGGNVVAHGYVMPGTYFGGPAPATLTVNGNVDFASDSTLMITGTDNAAGRLAVGGHATIDPGARLVVDAQAANWVAGQKYDVLVAAGGVTGTFASINSNFAFLNTLVAYSDTGNISLILQRNAAALADAAVTPNQRAVAMAAGSLGVGHAVYDRLVALDADTARKAFTSLAGDLHATAKGVVIDSQRQVRDAVGRHLADADLPGGGRADAGRVSTWISVLGRDADYDGDSNAGKADASGSGLLLGADLAVGDSGRVGLVLGHAREDVHERSVAGSAEVKSNHVGLYGDVAFDALHLSGGILQAHHAIDTRRDVVLGGDTGRAYASRDADTTQGFAELGYAFGQRGFFSAEPFVQAAVVHWDGGKATERGGTGALAVGSDDAHVTTTRAGAHLGMALDEQARFGLQATVAWQRAWGGTTPSARLRFAEGGDAFTATGVPLARNAGMLDAGIVVRLAPALRLDASYAGQFAGKVSDHGGRVSLNMTF
jgi:fibronectin-binding autotransporter adhesin